MQRLRVFAKAVPPLFAPHPKRLNRMDHTQQTTDKHSDLWLEEHWLEDHVRNSHPDLVPALEAAMSTFARASPQYAVTLKALAPLASAAASDRAPLYGAATGMLGRLTGTHEAAREVVAAMAGDTKWHVRFNAMLCVNESAPRPFALGILRSGLSDKSWRVREKAADWAFRCQFVDLLPELRQARALESNQSARKCIEYSIDGLVRERSGRSRKARK